MLEKRQFIRVHTYFINVATRLECASRNGTVFRGACPCFRDESRGCGSCLVRGCLPTGRCCEPSQGVPAPAVHQGPEAPAAGHQGHLNRKGLGTGTLYIGESHLFWVDGSGLAFSLEYMRCPGPPCLSPGAFVCYGNLLGFVLFPMSRLVFYNRTSESGIKPQSPSTDNCFVFIIALKKKSRFCIRKKEKKKLYQL